MDKTWIECFHEAKKKHVQGGSPANRGSRAFGPILNTLIDLVSLILVFMEIWSTLAKLLPKKPVLLPKIIC